MKTRICIFCSVTSLSPSIMCARDGVFSIQNTPSDFERSSSELASEISHACPPRRCQSTPSLELPSKLLETLSRAPLEPLQTLSRASRDPLGVFKNNQNRSFSTSFIDQNEIWRNSEIQKWSKDWSFIVQNGIWRNSEITKLKFSCEILMIYDFWPSIKNQNQSFSPSFIDQNAIWRNSEFSKIIKIGRIPRLL